jgi:hypothetical protein
VPGPKKRKRIKEEEEEPEFEDDDESSLSSVSMPSGDGSTGSESNEDRDFSEYTIVTDRKASNVKRIYWQYIGCIFDDSEVDSVSSDNAFVITDIALDDDGVEYFLYHPLLASVPVDASAIERTPCSELIVAKWVMWRK